MLYPDNLYGVMAAYPVRTDNYWTFSLYLPVFVAYVWVAPDSSKTTADVRLLQMAAQNNDVRPFEPLMLILAVEISNSDRKCLYTTPSRTL